MGLIYYVVIKVVRAFLILIFSISLIYITARSIPGDVITVLYGENIPDPVTRAQLEKALGLDMPLYIQLLSYFSRILRGDLGKSLYHGLSVSELIAQHLYASFILAILSSILMIILSLIATYIELVLGWGSKLLLVLSSASASLPTLGWGSILLIISIYIGLKISIGSIVGPLITLTIVGFGFFYRYLRAIMLNVMNNDFITMYIAMGISRRRIFLKVFRIALPEFLTVLLYRFGLILFSAIVVESLFRYPGMGSLFVLAIQSRDYPLLIGWSVVASITAISINTVIDIAHVVLDPRVKTYE